MLNIHYSSLIHFCSQLGIPLNIKTGLPGHQIWKTSTLSRLPAHIGSRRTGYKKFSLVENMKQVTTSDNGPASVLNITVYCRPMSGKTLSAVWKTEYTLVTARSSWNVSTILLMLAKRCFTPQENSAEEIIV